MITYENIQTNNSFTRGFEVLESEPMILVFESGSFSILSEKPIFNNGMIELKKEENKIDFPMFKINIEPDFEFPVVYDIYLLKEKNDIGMNIQVDRTEVTAETVCAYMGEAELLHCLGSFEVPPNTTSLEDIDIRIRNVQLKEV